MEYIIAMWMALILMMFALFVVLGLAELIIFIWRIYPEWRLARSRSYRQLYWFIRRK